MDPTPHTNPPHVIQISLNGNAVVAPVYRAVRDSMEVLGIALTAIEGMDLAKVPSMPNMMGFSLSSPEPIDVVERKTAYTNWPLSKACQDLARAINEALQEAYLYLEVFKMPGGPSTWGELETIVKTMRDRANKMHFLNKLRNCLEHRSGRDRARC
jgi:hypothetical protein